MQPAIYSLQLIDYNLQAAKTAVLAVSAVSAVFAVCAVCAFTTSDLFLLRVFKYAADCR